MGIILNSAYLMIAEGCRKPYTGKVLQLGKQSVLISYAQMQSLAKHLKYLLTDIGAVKDINAMLTDQQFFRLLGFSQVLSLEWGTDEAANYRWDLNAPVPHDWHNSFDLIYDGGTCEHVFHIPICLSNICQMLKIGGRVLHDNGVSGLIDHGFYSIQPTLYHDFYSAQQFEVNLASVSTLDMQTWLSHVGTQSLY
jgi:hypothetical protein